MAKDKNKVFLKELETAISEIKKGEVSELKREDLLKLINSNKSKTRE